jgi:FkbM family methyltransferase
MLTTKAKVSLAGVASRFVMMGRRLAGKKDSAIVVRKGIRYHLDLNEGIDFSIYFLGAFEARTQKSLQRLVRHGDVVFDIGANVGAHTLVLARCVGQHGKVYAFEPADFAFKKLRRNLDLNPTLQERTFLHQILLSESLSDQPERQIYASWPLYGERSVHPKHRGRLVSAEGACVDTLDEFVRRQQISRLDLVKMDVDGNELPVLRGGEETIRRFWPTLVMELSPYVHRERGHRFADFIEILKTAGYSICDAYNGQAIPLDADELESEIPDGASINVVAKHTRN